MTMDLAQYGLTAMNAAQVRLATASNNLSNAATPGYNRQQVIVDTAGAQATGSGYIGQGVAVKTVQRAVNAFVGQQLNRAQSQASALDAYAGQIGQLDDYFSDRTVGLAPALQGFFDGLQAVATSPADSATREQALGAARNLADQFNAAGQLLDNVRGDINMRIAGAVSDVNDTVARINVLNQAIIVAQGSASGQPPNDLLDQRDAQVAALQQLVNVQVVDQNGSVALMLGNHLLLSGSDQYALSAAQDPADPAEYSVSVALPGPGGDTAAIDASGLTGGTLGGLLAFRQSALDPLARTLGVLANGLALSANVLQAGGLDADSQPGGPLFNVAPVALSANQRNTGAASATAAYAPGAAAALQPSDYTLAYDGTGYRLTRLSDGTQFLPANPGDTSITADGLTVSFTGAAAAGDTWRVAPARSAATGLSVALSSSSGIAAADLTGGSANGANAARLANLQNAKILQNGQVGFADAYASLVSQVGRNTQQNSASLQAQQALVKQNYDAQQALSGVNVNEEYVNLQQFQNQYQAAARLVQISSQLFDALLGALN